MMLDFILTAAFSQYAQLPACLPLWEGELAKTIRTKTRSAFADNTFRRGGAFSGAEGAAHLIEAESKPRDMTVPTDKCESSGNFQDEKVPPTEKSTNRIVLLSCRRQRKA